MHNIDEFVTVTTYADDILSNEFLTVVKMIMKVYLVDNLKANILIDNDVLISQKIKLDSTNGKIIIGVC